jgi:signal transduction histidine kinase
LFSLNTLLLLGLVLVNLFLGFVVIKQSRNKQNFSFFLMIIATVGWTVVNGIADSKIGNISAILLANRLSFTFATFIAISFYLFTYYFPKVVNKTRVLNIVIIILGLLVAILTLSGTVVLAIKPTQWGFDIVYGGLYLAFVSYFILVASFSFFILWRKYKKLTGIDRLQIRYVLLGTFLTAALASITNLILPLLTGSNPLAKYGPYSILFLIGFTTYAIVKHKLMDIKAVVARSVTYAVLLLLLAGFYAAAIFAAQAFVFPQATYSVGYIALQIFLALIMAFSFQPLRRWITRITDTIFFKNAYDPETFLDTMSHTIGSSIVLIELLYKALNLITTQMKISRGIIVVLSDAGKIYTSQSMGYPVAPKISEEDIHKMVKDGTLVYDDLEENSHYKALLRKHNASVVVPLKTENGVEGLLILGEKLSGDMYSAGDLRVFEIIAPELAVAVNNAKSFEKIEKFNVTLREEVKKATAELEKKNTQLMELDKAKDEFISMASHQLRTPLTAIKGYLSMLLEGDAGEIKVSQYDFVNEAFQGANRMVGLINDLLNVSRMETGRFFLEPVEIDLDKLVQEEVKQLVQHAKEKKLELKYQEKGKTPHVWADETKIRQVVMNFIDNAVYYTTEGSVVVTLSHDAKDVIFEVKDSGIGVPKAQQKNLFTKFYRADNARHVRPDGTGLGIYLAKRVLDDHHAELIFRSKEGEGSVFGFRFPIKSKLSTKRVSAPTPDGSSCPPAIGELAAGVGISPQVLEATSVAGIEKPLSDSSDATTLSKEAVELSHAASGANSSMPDDILKSANDAIKTIQETEVKKEEEKSKKK